MLDTPGEVAERHRQNNFRATQVGFMLLGGFLAFISTTLGDTRSGALPPAAAITLVVLLLVGLGGGSIYFFRKVDEFEVRANMEASTIGLYAYVLLYPCWYFLWKGGLVAEPQHETLFLVTMIVMAGSYYWRKLRG